MTPESDTRWHSRHHSEITQRSLCILEREYQESYYDYADQRYYPGLYNTLSIFVTKMFPIKYQIEIIHIVNLVFGISTIIGISKISGTYVKSAITALKMLKIIFQKRLKYLFSNYANRH